VLKPFLLFVRYLTDEDFKLFKIRIKRGKKYVRTKRNI